MRTIANLLWLVLAGVWLAIGYVIAGIVACLLIVTIPFGIASFRLAGYSLWPFGRIVVRNPVAGVASLLGNVLWLLVAGWWLVLGHLVAGVLLMVTIIGIPFGIASIKLGVLALAPLGADVVAAQRGTIPMPPPPGTRPGPVGAPR